MNFVVNDLLALTGELARVRRTTKGTHMSQIGCSNQFLTCRLLGTLSKWTTTMELGRRYQLEWISEISTCSAVPNIMTVTFWRQM